MHYISLGLDCSPASALKELNIRTEALPLDWVDSNYANLALCFQENFARFHKKLTMTADRLRVADEYGFQFPHDYPKHDTPDQIIEEWQNYHENVLSKYERRINRFYDIFKKNESTIILFRGSEDKFKFVKNIIESNFKKDKIAYVIATTENKDVDNCFYCNPEQNYSWNESKIWQESIQKAVQLLT
jgi:hypothetical protein